MPITVIDGKGGIQIPEKIREEPCLKSGEEFEVKIEGKKIPLLPLISSEEFIERMEERYLAISPEEIKSIWKM